MIDMFNASGFEVKEMIGRMMQEPSAQMVEALRMMATAAGNDPDMAERDAGPFQYVIRATGV